jgi:hypothetical protein
MKLPKISNGLIVALIWVAVIVIMILVKAYLVKG